MKRDFLGLLGRGVQAAVAFSTSAKQRPFVLIGKLCNICNSNLRDGSWGPRQRDAHIKDAMDFFAHRLEHCLVSFVKRSLN